MRQIKGSKTQQDRERKNDEKILPGGKQTAVEGSFEKLRDERLRKVRQQTSDCCRRNLKICSN